jgi:hypothetical protein
MKAISRKLGFFLFITISACRVPADDANRVGPIKGDNTTVTAPADQENGAGSNSHGTSTQHPSDANPTGSDSQLASGEQPAKQGGGGSSTHGGDAVLLAFEKARLLAVEMLETYVAHPQASKESTATADEWLKVHGKNLIEEIRRAVLVPTDDELTHDAVTGHTRGSEIRLSRRLSKQGPLSNREAAALLIHECIHHFGITDESEAYSLTSRATELWQDKHSVTRTPSQVNRIRWPNDTYYRKRLGAPFLFDNGNKVVVWTTQWNPAPYGNEPFEGVGYLYSAADKSWSAISHQSQPSRFCATVPIGDKFIVFGNDGESQDNAIYDPVSNKWRHISNVPIYGQGMCPVPGWAFDTWTGTDLYLFFDNDFGDATKGTTGLRYNVERDSWHFIAKVPSEITSAHPWRDGDLIVTTKKAVFKYSPVDASWKKMGDEASHDDLSSFGIWLVTQNELIGFNREQGHAYQGLDNVRVQIMDLEKNEWRGTVQSSRAPINPYAHVLTDKGIAFAEREDKMRLHVFVPKSRDWEILDLHHSGLNKWEPSWSHRGGAQDMMFSWVSQSLWVFKRGTPQIYSLDFAK